MHSYTANAPPAHSKSRTPFSSIVLTLLLAIVALAPLPLGSNRPLPAALVGLGVGILLLVWIVEALQRSEAKVHIPYALGILIGLYALVCLWIFLQTAKWIPTAWADPIWSLSGKNLAQGLEGTISVNPSASSSVLMHMLAYLGVFWVSFDLSRKPTRARALLVAIVAIGALYSLYGIVTYFVANNALLFFSRWATQDVVASTFVNRNNFATFAGLCLLCGLSLTLSSLHPLLQQRRPKRQVLVLAVEHLIVRCRWLTAAALVTSVALLLTASRGGVSSTLVGATFLVFVYLHVGSGHRRVNWRQASVAAGLGIIFVALVATVAGRNLSNRLDHDGLAKSLDVRNQIYVVTLQAIRSAPWSGIGSGAYKDAIPAYKPNDMNPLVELDKAHDTYLENAFELGIPTALLLNISIAMLGVDAWKGARRRRKDVHMPILGAAATLLVGLHSLVDFSLQIPAVSILYAATMGIAVAQSRSTATV